MTNRYIFSAAMCLAAIVQPLAASAEGRFTPAATTAAGCAVAMETAISGGSTHAAGAVHHGILHTVAKAESGIEAVAVGRADDNNSVEIYDINGRRLAAADDTQLGTLEPGVYIIRSGRAARKVIVTAK